MTVIKRDRSSSHRDLITAIAELVILLKDQDEEEACAALEAATQQLKNAQPGDDSHRAALAAVVDAFEGEHELSAYVLDKPNPQNWTITEQLSQASTRVLNLARRLR